MVLCNVVGKWKLENSPLMEEDQGVGWKRKKSEIILRIYVKEIMEQIEETHGGVVAEGS